MANYNPPKNGFDRRPEDINRSGKPPQYFNKLIRDIGEEIDVNEKQKMKELVSRRLWREAQKGNMIAINTLLDRLDGKVTQPTDLTTGGERIDLLHIYKPEKNKKGEK